jgi:hypothetical protein
MHHHISTASEALGFVILAAGAAGAFSLLEMAARAARRRLAWWRHGGRHRA